jgi:predicted amino acid-binding ACT domain protein
MKYSFFIIALFAISFTSFSQTRIDISQVSQHVGDSILVMGNVSDTSYSQIEAATVLQIAQPNGGSFDVVVKTQNRNNFQYLFQNNLINKYVRVVGKVTSSGGRNKIYVTTGDQLVMILGQ